MPTPSTPILTCLCVAGLTFMASTHSVPVLAEEYVEVCVGSDRIMRTREHDVSFCPTGEESLRLSLWQQEEPEEEPDEEPEDDPEESEDADRRFQAPFEVVDGSGNVIFRIDVDNSVMSPRAQLLRGHQPAIEWGVIDGGDPGLVMYYGNGVASVELGANADRDNPALRVNNIQGKQLAGIGIDDDARGVVSVNGADTASGASLVAGRNGGIVFVRDIQGKHRAGIGFNADGAGSFDVFNVAGEGVLTLTEARNGGQLQIKNHSGTSMVEAGVIPSGVGVVRTGPGGSLQTSMTIPSFIMGKVAGQ